MFAIILRLSRKQTWRILVLGAVMACLGLLDVIFALALKAGIRTFSIPTVMTFTPPTTFIPYLELRGLTLGAITIAAAVAIARRRPWAWSYSWMVLGMAILFALADLVLWGANLEYTMVTVAIPAVILVYLSRPDIRQAFGHSVSTTTRQ